MMIQRMEFLLRLKRKGNAWSKEWFRCWSLLPIVRAGPPRTSVLEQNRAPNGDYFIWLDPRFIERLRALGGAGDVILRLAG